MSQFQRKKACGFGYSGVRFTLERHIILKMRCHFQQDKYNMFKRISNKFIRIASKGIAIGPFAQILDKFQEDFANIQSELKYKRALKKIIPQKAWWNPFQKQFITPEIMQKISELNFNYYLNKNFIYTLDEHCNVMINFSHSMSDKANYIIMVKENGKTRPYDVQYHERTINNTNKVFWHMITIKMPEYIHISRDTLASLYHELVHAARVQYAIDDKLHPDRFGAIEKEYAEHKKLAETLHSMREDDSEYGDIAKEEARAYFETPDEIHAYAGQIYYNLIPVFEQQMNSIHTGEDFKRFLLQDTVYSYYTNINNNISPKRIKLLNEILYHLFFVQHPQKKAPQNRPLENLAKKEMTNRPASPSS